MATGRPGGGGNPVFHIVFGHTCFWCLNLSGLPDPYYVMLIPTSRELPCLDRAQLCRPIQPQRSDPGQPEHPIC